MLRLLLLSLLVSASAAAADGNDGDIDLTPGVASDGLSATITALQADPASPARDFALGGVQFLRAVEKTLQMRYRHGADFDDLPLPVLRLPVPPNPEAEPMYPGLVTELFRDVIADMAAARATLEGADASLGVTLDLTRVWFDINANGASDAGESLMEAAGAAFGRGAPGQPMDALVVRFDAADAAWLRAYTHLLEGFGHLVLAFDPTDVIAEVGESSAQIKALRGTEIRETSLFFEGEERAVDLFSIVYGAVNRPPDVEEVHAFRNSLLAMVAENRAFWTLVRQEEDDDREWIPAADQTSALGIELPSDTRETWLAVLDDAEALLRGERLFGHWRLDGRGGVNVARLLENPVPVDIVTWFNGQGLVDFMEEGPVVSDANLRRFRQMFRGDALLFMVWLN